MQRRTHSANCVEDRRNSPGAVLGPVVYMPVIVQRGAQFGLAGRRHSCRGAEADSYGPVCSENHRVSSVAVH